LGDIVFVELKKELNNFGLKKSTKDGCTGNQSMANNTISQYKSLAFGGIDIAVQIGKFRTAGFSPPQLYKINPT
jgi:hypothetical protein